MRAAACGLPPAIRFEPCRLVWGASRCDGAKLGGGAGGLGAAMRLCPRISGLGFAGALREVRCEGAKRWGGRGSGLDVAVESSECRVQGAEFRVQS